jgi:CheY-like chemotaxis protein
VIDDEAEVGESIRRILGRENDVFLASRGAEAIPMVVERQYDLILCDLLMPDMTGMELYEKVIAAAPDKARQIVFMSGGAFSPGARAFLDRVPNRRIEKPIDTTELRALVAKPPGPNDKNDQNGSGRDDG